METKDQEKGTRVGWHTQVPVQQRVGGGGGGGCSSGICIYIYIYTYIYIHTSTRSGSNNTISSLIYLFFALLGVPVDG